MTFQKENKKDKKQIIEWTIKKTLNFSLDDSIIETTSKSETSYFVGVGESSSLDEILQPLENMGWEIRSCYPSAQTIYNSFIWNYPDHKKEKYSDS